MRAKMKLTDVKRNEYCENLTFNAVCKSSGYPESGLDEDNTFAKFSPTARLEITITNPALLGAFNPGETYYVDFTPVPVPAAQP